MASDMSQPTKKKSEDSSHENRVCNQICQGKSQNCDGDRRSSHAGANGKSSFSEKLVEEKAVKGKNCGSCGFNSNRTETLSEDVAEGSFSRLRYAENADDNACLHDERESCTACDDPQDSDMEQVGATLEDMFLKNGFDDEEDDDSDWEPTSNYVLKRWICSNCTVPNFNDILHCLNCGEPKGSEVSGYDAFQIHLGQATLVPVDTALPSVSTAIGFDERMLLHTEIEMKAKPHPERPDRLRAIAASLVNAGIFPSKCALIPAREITKEELIMVHTPEHVETIEQTKNMFYCYVTSDTYANGHSACAARIAAGLCADLASSIMSEHVRNGFAMHKHYFTSDTYANGHSACAARIAAGLCADLACSIMSGRVRNGFAMVRPPGHHAGVKQAMGFCLHNNAAVAALAAQRAGAKKVLIVDWDVHHGNGTQEIFESDKSVLYISLHRHEDGRFYPGTGAAHEVGVMEGQGFSVNIPWSCGGVGDNDYIFAFQHVVLPIALEFAPDITILSAGFDAARGDPLGCCDVTPGGYSRMASMLTTCSEGKLLVILEGGYNLRSISSSATEVVKVLLGENPSYDTNEIVPSKEGLQTVLQVLEIQHHFWPALASTYASLQSLMGSTFSKNSNKQQKRKRFMGPLWWKWGSKRFLYKLLYERRHAKKLKTHGTLDMC